MDLSSLNSFLRVIFKPLNSPSRRHVFDKLPEAVVNVILQHFLPPLNERNAPFNRLVRVQLLQSNQARCPGLHGILYQTFSIEGEVIWKNKLDDACKREQQRESGSLFIRFWKDPRIIITHPYFPSPAFIKQPCMTYIQRSFNSGISTHHHKEVRLRELEVPFFQNLNEGISFNPQNNISLATALIECIQKDSPTVLTHSTLNLEEPVKAFSLLTGAVAMSGISYSMAKAVYDFKLTVALIVQVWLFIDLIQKGFSSSDLFGLPLTFTFVTMVAGSLIPSRIQHYDDFIPGLDFKSRTQRWACEMKESLREIWHIGSTSVRERVGLAQLLLLANRARTTES